MSRRGGNVRGMPSESKRVRVQNEPETLLKLLKVFPNVFGSLSSSQAHTIFPAVVFRAGEGSDKIGAFFDSAIFSTNPSAHDILGRIALPESSSFARAYLVRTEDVHLYPKTSDLGRIGLSSEDVSESLAEIKDRMQSHPIVEAGGLVKDGQVLDLATMALEAQKVLRSSHDVNLGLVAAGARFRQAIDRLLITEQS